MTSHIQFNKWIPAVLHIPGKGGIGDGNDQKFYDVRIEHHVKDDLTIKQEIIGQLPKTIFQGQKTIWSYG